MRTLMPRPDLFKGHGWINFERYNLPTSRFTSLHMNEVHTFSNSKNHTQYLVVAFSINYISLTLKCLLTH